MTAILLALALITPAHHHHRHPGRRHHHHRCWTGVVPVQVARIGGPWRTVWVRETICGNTVTFP